MIGISGVGGACMATTAGAAVGGGWAGKTCLMDDGTLSSEKMESLSPSLKK
jgi:hypothetical protein